MNRALTRLLSTLFGIVFIVAAGAAQETPAAAGMDSKCSQCHLVPDPGHGNAPLRACERPPAPAEHEVSEAPDFFILDQLSDIYVPVVFPHKLHASMTEMGEGCNVCHHRNPPGRILPCRDCHGGPSNPVDLEQPGLKGAYHRQCLGCHREWSHETDCAICHAKRDPAKTPELHLDKTDIMGKLHPNVTQPDVKLYRVEGMEEMELVTFSHRSHVNAYGLRCVECHREENCSSCHDNGAPEVERVREEPHQDCSRCHQPEVEADCSYCHGEKQKPPFDHHERTGFELAAYHDEVQCRACHEGNGRFERAPTQCDSCHDGGFDPASFDHARTGAPLDEMHQALDCVDCHTEGVGAPGKCDGCHDDGRTTFETGP